MMKPYSVTRAEAQEKANRHGADYGIMRDHFGGYGAWVLPKPSNRHGLERRCEVISPTTQEGLRKRAERYNGELLRQSTVGG